MTVLPWQMSVWLTVVPCGGVCVYIGVYITQAHRHSITLFRFLHCEGAVSAATEQQQTRILSFHQFYKVESLSLSLPATTQSGPTLRCDAKLSKGLTHSVTQYSFTLFLSKQILPCNECWGSPGNTNFACLQGGTFTQLKTRVFRIFPRPPHRQAGSVLGQYTWQQISQYTRTSILTGPVLTPLTPDKLPSVKSILARK